MNLFVPLLAARLNEIWYLLPLAVAISLVYSGTRYERADDILIGSFRSLVWIVGFVVISLTVLWLISRLL